jgi:hypothetical protein
LRGATKETRQAAEQPGGFASFKNLHNRSNYWSGGFVAELGLTDLIQVITFQRSSEVLKMVPKGGIGPTTTSCLTRL